MLSRWPSARPKHRITELLLAALLLALATVLAALLAAWLLPNVAAALVLLAGVIAIALSTRLWIAQSSAVLGALLFNALFTEPRWSLHMANIEDIVTLAVFLALALLMTYLAHTTRQQQSRLADAELRAKLLLSLSHDLRTPLTSIIGNLSTLDTYQKQLTPAVQTELWQAARSEAERLNHYLENLLQATKLEHGAVALKLEPTDVAELIKRTLASLSQQEQFELTLTSPHFKVAAQSALLQQALFNLLDNAQRYSADNALVYVTLRKLGQELLLVIENSAEGLTDMSLSYWFEPFLKGSGDGDHAPAGTGLGLAVAAAIVRAHQGRIEAQRDASLIRVQIFLPLLSDDTPLAEPL